MNWDAIGAIGELFGGIIVVASVVYLAAQIRLYIKTSQDEAYREVFSQLNEQFDTLAEPHHACLVLKGLLSFENLSPEEKFRFDMLLHAFFVTLESSIISNSADLIFEETMENWSHYIRPRFLAYPGLVQWWMLSKRNFHPDAQSWVDRQIKATSESDIWGITK